MQATPLARARHATPRGVKQRHELRARGKMRLRPEDAETEETTATTAAAAAADRSDSYSSTSGEGHADESSR